jgi:predicted house-cleaning noncanonical NTP pyrophosphatase (MazG superfamily)
VVRTDFRAATTRPIALSGRTDTCLDLGQVESFLSATARSLIDQGVDPADVAFLAHRFLPARAGALSFARRGGGQVLIDATWGLPDGLLFHPHDSYRVDRGRGRVSRYLRCKTDYIDVDGGGRWLSRPSGRPWDWRSTLSDAEAVEIAGMSETLAHHVAGDVEVMFFIGSDVEGRHSILPWFYSGGDPRIGTVEPSRGFYVGERVTVRNEADVRAIEHKLTSAPDETRVALTLRPDIELVRSREFIQSVARVAERHRLPVELEGSQLSHAYYLLDEAGVAVRCVNPWKRPERRQAFGKLVRDLIPVKIQRGGELVTVYSAGRQELTPLIRAKVVEEALEYFWASEGTTAVEELADLLELLHAAARVRGVDFAAVERVAAEKRRERGGFEEGIVLVETRQASDGQRMEPSSPGQERPFFQTVPGVMRRRPLQRRRVVRLPGKRLVIPLVPPERAVLGGEFTLALEGNEEVRVSYDKASVRLQIRERVEAPGSAQLQLKL